MAEKETKSYSEGCEEMTDNEVIKALEVCAYSDACLKECPFFNYKAGCTKRLTASALEIIKRLQFDVAPVKHGHWINENFYTHCSVCGNMAIYDKYGQEVESDYCPKCGARMDGEPDANGNDNKTPET